MVVLVVLVGALVGAVVVVNRGCVSFIVDIERGGGDVGCGAGFSGGGSVIRGGVGCIDGCGGGCHGGGEGVVVVGVGG